MKKLLRFACFVQVLFGLAFFSGRTARAQSNSEEVFNMLFEQGSKAADKDNFNETIAAWIPAYRIKPHYKIACGIGRLSLRLERLVEAATWLNRCRLTAPPPKTDEGIARRGTELVELEVAKAHLITAAVHAEPGATIFAHGDEMGIAPLNVTLFFAPGKNSIEARKSGETMTIAFEGERGQELTIDLRPRQLPARVVPISDAETPSPLVTAPVPAPATLTMPSWEPKPATWRSWGKIARSNVYIFTMGGAFALGGYFALVSEGMQDSHEMELSMAVKYTRMGLYVEAASALDSAKSANFWRLVSSGFSTAFLIAGSTMASGWLGAVTLDNVSIGRDSALVQGSFRW